MKIGVYFFYGIRLSSQISGGISGIRRLDRLMLNDPSVDLDLKFVSCFGTYVSLVLINGLLLRSQVPVPVPVTVTLLI
jgi:hypothetical protein